MGGFAHLARQLLFFATEWPQTVARADHFLGGPQYWAWRLSGVATAEFTYYGAQSHLWDVRRRRLTTIVDRQGWRRLLPEPTSAWRRLGPLRPALAIRYGLPQGIDVIAGNPQLDGQLLPLSAGPACRHRGHFDRYVDRRPERRQRPSLQDHGAANPQFGCLWPAAGWCSRHGRPRIRNHSRGFWRPTRRCPSDGGTGRCRDDGAPVIRRT